MIVDDREAAVREVTRRWLEATVKADVPTLDSLLEAGYTFTHATTAITDTRDEWLESFRSGRRRYRAWEIFDVSVRLFPCAAIMTGRGRQELVRPDEIFVLNTSFSNVWVEQDGRWQLAVWQATLVPDA
jgi:hypothetical protein